MKIENYIDAVQMLKGLSLSLGFIGMKDCDLILCDKTICTDERDIQAYNAIQYLIDYVRNYN